MERLFDEIDIAPILGKRKVKKPQINISRCLNCGSDNVIPVKDIEHKFDGVKNSHDGVICGNCKCFHYIDDNNIVYEYTYVAGAINKEMNWDISEN